MCQKFKEFFPN
ncbi:hypothetical protein GW931_00785 [archaeon]|nr:hypothetical protein [archaeon]PJC45435.1 MAG: hypothetical protein CO037_01530 [Candidatus Pacearchaeota archaeon CG_4_9_14_0_2_um_filter_30_8]